MATIVAVYLPIVMLAIYMGIDVTESTYKEVSPVTHIIANKPVSPSNDEIAR